MKAISHWAQANKWKTVAILIPLHIVLCVFYLLAGVYLFAGGITFPEKIVYLGHGIILIAWICYPFKRIKKGFYKNRYWKRKLWQGAMLLATAVYITNAGNQLARSSLMIEQTSSYQVQPIVLGPKKSIKEHKKQSKKERRLTRKNLKKQLRAFVKDIRKSRKNRGEGKEFAKFLLILLAIIVAGFIGAGILALSCNLSCSGQEGLAALVLVGGGIALIWGLIAVVRSIMRMGDKPKKVYNNPD